tara:strand:- start:569 stop:802 length:234 start_codon:yes stop_codon:yes gene_type:complete
MKDEMTVNVNIYRSVWGLLGGKTKNNCSIKPTQLDHSFFIWGQPWGQDLPRMLGWDVRSDTQSYFFNKHKPRNGEIK